MALRICQTPCSHRREQNRQSLLHIGTIIGKEAHGGNLQGIFPHALPIRLPHHLHRHRNATGPAHPFQQQRPAIILRVVHIHHRWRPIPLLPQGFHFQNPHRLVLHQKKRARPVLCDQILQLGQQINPIGGCECILKPLPAIQAGAMAFQSVNQLFKPVRGQKRHIHRHHHHLITTPCQRPKSLRQPPQRAPCRLPVMNRLQVGRQVWGCSHPGRQGKHQR